MNRIRQQYFDARIVKVSSRLRDCLHGIGGSWGALATGLFATTTVNPGAANGLFYGNPNLLWIQFVAIMATAAYVMVVTLILAKLVNAVMGLRVPDHEEVVGLDLTQHGEARYHM